MRALLAVVLIYFAAFVPTAPRDVTFEHGTVTITQGAKRATLAVEVATTASARAMGLMNRKHLDENAGMLFVFEEPGRWAFWMKNTLIPLSIAFVDRQGEIVDVLDMAVARDPEKGPFDFYQAAKPSLMALEVNQGFFARHGITPGARLSVSLHPRTLNPKHP